MPDQNTARLGLPLLQPAQAQKHVTVNDALVRLDGVDGLDAKEYQNDENEDRNRAAVEAENHLLRAAFLQSRIRAARVDYREAAADFLNRLAILAGLDRLAAENNCRIPVFADHRRGCVLPGLNDSSFELTDLDILETADQLRGDFNERGFVL